MKLLKLRILLLERGYVSRRIRIDCSNFLHKTILPGSFNKKVRYCQTDNFPVSEVLRYILKKSSNIPKLFNKENSVYDLNIIK